MWRSVNASFSKYSIELAQLLCRCLKDPHRDKALARYKLHLKQTDYTNGVAQAPVFHTEFKEPTSSNKGSSQ
ncbi:mitochondrial ATP synthase F1 subunit epsilon, putative [Theileria equi strain WA]|uniref:Mitochondrial ATP synthase F1 subunit epsilon, putative n=1 Tax=Theileria equi strain WA TaxID=1537102 RepID=L1LBY8_THEEQ|nr:mitochondrial ATP synthase F1 subunit epsilon, putative [Theileria equi strain WA]EKX72962.1 mitochondrial ATP synthase F1 subunit epsilon, putative [Theileria equi strain WA]|eukprot:XP_004832414.1 mitochondrial ATP synthase F1 subunit epsilon, putative [Theileria equi strain WA]